jgi:membrane protein
MVTFKSIISTIESRVPIPAPVHKAIFVIVTLLQDLIRCDLVKQAYAMAYVTLLSLIPSLAAVFCVLSFFTPAMGKDGGIINEAKAFVLNNLATGSGESAVAYIDNMLSNLNLASIGWSSFAAMLVTLIMLLKQIEGALNRIWLVRKGRNTVTRFIYFWTFLTLGALVIAIVVGATSWDIKETVAAAEQQADSGIVSGIFAWFGGFVFFFALYKFVPKTNVHSKNAAIGAAISGLMLHQASRFYGIFVSDFSNYQSIYGALAAVPLFLMWIWICWLIILLGSLIAWRMQQGFPKDKDEDTIDAAKNPVEKLRNVQMRGLMPLISMLAIYKNFAEGTGKGLSLHDLVDKLKLPVGWLTEALDALESMGYIVPSAADPNTTSYFPTFPANSLKLGKMIADLQKPSDDWLNNWNHELSIDISEAIHKIYGPDRPAFSKLNLEDALAQLPEAKIPDSAPIN